MPIKFNFLNFKELFDRESKLKKDIHFYFVSGALITILLPPEYNNPFLIFFGLNSILDKNLISNLKLALKNPVVLLPFAFWLLLCLSLFYSDNTQIGYKEISKTAALGVFPIFFAIGPKLSAFQIQKLKWHYIISISILALFSIYSSFSKMYINGQFKFDWLELSYENLVSGVGVQPLYFSMFIALALFFLFEIQRIHRTGIAQILMTVFLFIYMIMLSTRMTTLAFFVIFGLYNLALLLKNRKYIYQPFAFFIFVFSAAIIIFFNPISNKRFAEALNPNSSYRTDQYGGRSIRIEKWKCTLDVFLESPILGVGVGDLQDRLLNCYSNKSIDAALFYKFNSHNQYLNTLGQIGLPGILVLLALILLSIKTAIKRNDDMFLIFILLFSMCMVSESMLERRWGIFFFIIFYCIFHLYESPISKSSIIFWVKNKYFNKQ